MGFRSTLTTFLRDVDRKRAEIIGVRSSRLDVSGKGAEGPTPPRIGAPRAGDPVRTIGARTVAIEKVVRETDDAVSLVLRDLNGAPFRFSPGQFLTLVVEIAGERLRRSYSISSSADESQLATITVKKVMGGKVSGYLVERAQEGMRLEVLGPAGAFSPSSAISSPRRLVLVAGGSGITPMMSIARTMLARERATRIDLVYGNRSVRDIIFKDALDALAEEHAPRLVVRHVLGEVLDRHVAARELDVLEANAGSASAEAEYFVCGPEPMMREVRAALAERGVPDAQVRQETFTPASSVTLASADDAARPSSDPKTVRLRIKGEAVAAEIAITTETTILRAALAAGIELPHSCTEGICGACRVRVCDPAAVDMAAVNCLSSSEIREGYILTCVSRARRDLELEVE